MKKIVFSIVLVCGILFSGNIFAELLEISPINKNSSILQWDSVNNDRIIELEKKLVLLKDKLKKTKYWKILLKLEKKILEFDDKKLLSIKNKLEKFDLESNKYSKYRDILMFLKIKINIEDLKRKEQKKETVNIWDTIIVTYTGSLEDGIVFDASSNHPGQTLSFKVWEWNMIPWFENWVIWMKLGETKTIKIDAKEAYWETNELLLTQVDFDAIAKWGLNKEDMVVWINKIWNVWEVEILRIEGDKYYAKHPNPLAWKNLIFEVKIDKINDVVIGNIEKKVNKNTPLVVEAWKLWINTANLNKCISENKFLNKINKQMNFGSDNFGISWTPWNVLINNETGEYVVISGAYPKEDFIKNIDKLLEDIEYKTKIEQNLKDKKTFKENLDKNTMVIISDKRNSSVDIELLIKDLKNVTAIKNMKIEQYDFFDNNVEKFLKDNNINVLPAIIFTSDQVDENIDQYLTKLNDNSYSLNIGSSFNPFLKRIQKWFKVIDKDLLKEIKANSYIDWNKNAKITWLEYSDLECPYCAKLHNSDVESSLKEKYNDDLNIIFNHFPLGFHKKAIPWANILECVWQEGWSEAFYKILKYAYKNRIQE